MLSYESKNGGLARYCLDANRVEGFTEFDRFSINRYRLRDPLPAHISMGEASSLASYQAAPPRDHIKEQIS